MAERVLGEELDGLVAALRLDAVDDVVPDLMDWLVGFRWRLGVRRLVLICIDTIPH